MSQSQLRSKDAVTPPARAERTAVILNKNAKRVTERVRRRIVEVAPEADVFFTETLEQAKFVTRRVVDSGYGTVVTGGGDGTVVNTIQDVLDRVETTGRERPRFGVLRLGTGNAVADFLGARDYARDLRTSAAPRPATCTS
ncbi:MAG: diacylglycerol kinase family protein [bacterium]